MSIFWRLWAEADKDPQGDLGEREFVSGAVEAAQKVRDEGPFTIPVKDEPGQMPDFPYFSPSYIALTEGRHPEMEALLYRECWCFHAQGKLRYIIGVPKHRLDIMNLKRSKYKIMTKERTGIGKDLISVVTRFAVNDPGDIGFDLFMLFGNGAVAVPVFATQAFRDKYERLGCTGLHFAQVIVVETPKG